jgi:hypothetical protein
MLGKVLCCANTTNQRIYLSSPAVGLCVLRKGISKVGVSIRVSTYFQGEHFSNAFLHEDGNTTMLKNENIVEIIFLSCNNKDEFLIKHSDMEIISCVQKFT